tara:strand:+ start:208 stop:633 length:426 start_codon:yes stop_codon:yes gene_type:complete
MPNYDRAPYRMPTMTDKIVGTTSEGRNKYENVDGSHSSERLVSFEIDGRTYNYPSIFGGKDIFSLHPKTPEGRNAAWDEIIYIFKNNSGYDPDTNVYYGDAFNDEDAAIDAAKNRSRSHREVDMSDINLVIEKQKARKRKR